MRVKAKSSSTPYPIWIEGKYITEPPIRITEPPKLLPCVNEAGVSDTASMEIIGTIAERGVQESESKGKKQ